MFRPSAEARRDVRNRLGMIVDVAHASYATVQDVVAESRAPVILSHSNLNTGAEHVAIGSDMDGNYRPVLTEYGDFPLLAAALLFRGVGERDAARVLGMNFLRLFDGVAAAEVNGE